MAATAIPAATAQITYEDLYARWEKGNWSATELDFSQDRIDWHERMSPEQRDAALWLFCLFFHGEDSVTDNLSPYIDAAPLEEQKYFLATQQVDEARHAVFFNRFINEVVGRGDGSIGGGLRATEKLLSWGHRKTFGHLDEVAAGLRKDQSPLNLARAVTMYHLIVEGALAQPTQHKIDEALGALDVLPGFREGMANVSLDEQRHIAFGVRLLADLHAADPGPVGEAIVSKFREVLPWTTAVALPPDRNLAYTEPLGIDLLDLFEEGATLLEQRLKAVGLSKDELARFPLPLDLPPRERARRGLKLLDEGMLGPKDVAPSRDPEAIEILMDTLRRGADPTAAPAGMTLQWDFTDAEPWFLRLDNGSTAIEPGRATKADVTLTMSWEDFIDVAAGREDPRRLVLRRRIRPRGRLRALARLPKVLPA
jgi:hypothetical protein